MTQREMQTTFFPTSTDGKTLDLPSIVEQIHFTSGGRIFDILSVILIDLSVKIRVRNFVRCQFYFL